MDGLSAGAALQLAVLSVDAKRHRGRRSDVSTRSREAANACLARASYGGGPEVMVPAIRRASK